MEILMIILSFIIGLCGVLFGALLDTEKNYSVFVLPLIAGICMSFLISYCPYRIRVKAIVDFENKELKYDTLTVTPQGKLVDIVIKEVKKK